jgi:hypothetical protein
MIRTARGMLMLGIAFGLLTSQARAGDRKQVWRTLTTPHFFIHYYNTPSQKLGTVAQRVAERVERAHEVLVRQLNHWPSGRTHVVIKDHTDSSNGYANVIPRNQMTIFVTSPAGLGTLSDYDDWLYGLLVHEYVHVLHMDNIGGIAKVFNAIFGKTWAPNQMQPGWFIEGLATYHESAQSAAGRMRSSIFDMMLRMEVLDNAFLRIDQMSSNTRLRPRGNIPYLYGGRFLKYIAERFGPDKLASIATEYGATAIPYSINTVAKKILGVDYHQLYSEFEAYLKQRYRFRLRKVRERGETPFQRFTDTGEACRSPRFSLDGSRLVFVDSTPYRDTLVNFLDPKSQKIVNQLRIPSIGEVDLSPDGNHLLYQQNANWQGSYAFNDLYWRNLKTGVVRRLTHGLRARDPAISPDGKTVAFVATRVGRHDLMLLSLSDGKAKTLIRGKIAEFFFSPHLSPDGQRVVFAQKKAGGGRDIVELDLENRAQRKITDDRALDDDPVYSADGERIYFSSDRTGIFNIYAYGRGDGTLKQVTNVIGGAFAPAVDPKEERLYYVGYSAKGYDLHHMRLEKERFLSALPYRDRRPPPAVFAEGKTYPSKTYRPWTTLLPQAWTYRYGSDAYGAAALGLEFGGSDIAGLHEYFISMDVSTHNGRPGYALKYIYRGLWPELSVSTSRYESPRTYQLDGAKAPYVEERYNTTVAASLPLLRIPDHNVSLGVDYRYQYSRDMSDTQVLVLPGMLTPQLPALGTFSGIGFRLSYSSTRSYALSISTERGRAISLGMRVFFEGFGSDYNNTELTASWTEFVPMPFFKHHVLALRLSGGLSKGARRRAFGLGGFPSQDFFNAVIKGEHMGSHVLRGYTPNAFVGDHFYLLNIEYRLPLFDIEWGLSSLPIYFKNVYMGVFVDVGDAFVNDFEAEKMKVGVGGEIMLAWVVGYVQDLTLRVGYARGLMEEGSDEFHFLIGRPF